MKHDEFAAALAFALEREQAAVAFYADLESRAAFAAQKATLAEFRLMEEGHVALVRSLQARGEVNLSATAAVDLGLARQAHEPRPAEHRAWPASWRPTNPRRPNLIFSRSLSWPSRRKSAPATCMASWPPPPLTRSCARFSAAWPPRRAATATTSRPCTSPRWRATIEQAAASGSPRSAPVGRLTRRPLARTMDTIITRGCLGVPNGDWLRRQAATGLRPSGTTGPGWPEHPWDKSPRTESREPFGVRPRANHRPLFLSAVAAGA